MSLINPNRNTAFLFAIHVMIIGVVFGLFTKLTKIPTFWPSVIVVLLITVFNNPIVLMRRSVLLTYALLSVIIVYDTLGHFNGLPIVATQNIGPLYIIYPYLLVAIIIENLLIFKKNSNAIIIRIGKFGLWVLIVAITISVISEIMFGGIMRSHITQTQDLPFWAWSVSFGTIYSMPFVLMSVIMCYKGKKYTMYIIIFLFVFTIIRSGFMIALVITGVGSLMALLYRLNIKAFYFNIILVLVVILLSLSNINKIVSFLPKLPNQIYAEKASDISKINENHGFIDILASTRQGVYDTSINTFIEHPIFGSGNFIDSGQHSYILDRLSFVGIIGTFSYMVVLFTFFKRSSLLIEKSERKVYGYIIGTMFVFLLFNPIEWPDFWLSMFVIIPSIILYLSKVKDKKYILVKP